MGRKVSVGLEADVAGFIKNVLAADASVDDLGDKVVRLDDELDKIPADAAKAAAALKLLSGSVDDVGHKVTSLGEKNVHLATLEAKIRETRTEVRKLGDEFVKTGDVDVFKKLGDATSRLKVLQDTRSKIKSALIPDDLAQDAEKLADGFFKRFAGRAEEWGNKIGQMLPSAISGALANPVAGPIIAAGLIAALLAAVDLVLANIGGLVLAAGGGGILGLGILGAVLGNPSTVGHAWAEEITGIRERFLGASSVLSGPLITAAHEFGAAFSGINLDKIFANAGTWIGPLVDGAAQFVRWIGLAAEYLSSKAGPVMQVLADELPKLGHAIATATKSIADNSEGGAAALKDLLYVVEMIIAGVGGMIGAAERGYGAFVKLRSSLPLGLQLILFGPEQVFNLQRGATAAKALGDAAKSTVVDFDVMNETLNRTSASLESLEGAIVDKIFQATMGLDQALLNVNESLLKVTDSIKQNGRATDEHSEKGIANRRVILGAVQDNMALYQAQLKAGMSAEDAARQYDDNTAALERQLRKSGVAQGEIDKLIGKYKGIPHQVDTDIAINGLTSAINGLADLIRLINGIHDKTVTVYYRTKGQSLNAPLAHGGIRRAAVGMLIPPSDPGTTLVGEPQTGGEALIPLRGISQSRAMDLAQTVGNAYGFRVSAAHGYADMRSAGQMGWSGGGGPTQLELTLRVDPARDTGVGSLVQRAFANQEIQVYAGGQRVQARL